MKVQGVDFAFSDRVTADNSAFVSLGKKDDKFTVFDCQLKKGMSAYEQLNFIKESCHSVHHYDEIALEENSIKSISKDIEQFGLPIKLYWTGASDPAASKQDHKKYDFPGIRKTVGKINLIMRLGTAFENGKFVLPYKTEEDKKITDRILAECTSFALADGKLVEGGIHPDIPIALGYALESINQFDNVVVMF